MYADLEHNPTACNTLPDDYPEQQIASQRKCSVRERYYNGRVHKRSIFALCHSCTPTTSHETPLNSSYQSYCGICSRGPHFSKSCRIKRICIRVSSDTLAAKECSKKRPRT